MKEKQIAIILFIMCLVLTIGICIQVKTIDNATIGKGSNAMQNDLRDEVLKMEEKYKRTTEQLKIKEDELDKLINDISIFKP